MIPQRGAAGQAAGLSGLREGLLVALAGLAATVAVTYPLALHPASLTRANLDDGRFSIWNVAWVARTLVVDPLHVFDANIFYPNTSTLAYSEHNLGAGILAIPTYWLSGRDPYLAHNVTVLAAFVLTFLGTYYLVRYLTAARGASLIAAAAFAFTPFILAHTPHIQLLMDAFLPISMLAFHRLADRPTVGRGAQLGVAMAAQAICCGYYAVFIVFAVGFSVIVVAWTRRLWTDRAYWIAIAAAAALSVVIVWPIFLPYERFQQVGVLDRPLSESARWSADWRSYLASAAYAHAPLRRAIGHWAEVMFPGGVAIVGGVLGLRRAWADGRRELVAIYGGLAALALWASFGPSAGLYRLLYKFVPVFGLLHAPSRFGLVVALGLCVLAGVGYAHVLSMIRQRTFVASILTVVAVAELAVGIDFRPPPVLSPAYRVLAGLPRAPVVELPFFEIRGLYPRHTNYMLASTAHWMPLVNGYSDYFPDDFVRDAVLIAPFPFPSAFKVLEQDGVRYAMVHLDVYDQKTRAEVEGRLVQFEAALRPLYVDHNTRLFEIVGYPK